MIYPQQVLGSEYCIDRSTSDGPDRQTCGSKSVNHLNAACKPQGTNGGDEVRETYLHKYLGRSVPRLSTQGTLHNCEVKSREGVRRGLLVAVIVVVVVAESFWSQSQPCHGCLHGAPRACIHAFPFRTRQSSTANREPLTGTPGGRRALRGGTVQVHCILNPE